MNNPIHVGFVSVDFRSSRGDNAKETDRHSRNFERFFRDRGSRLERSDEFGGESLPSLGTAQADVQQRNLNYFAQFL